MRSNLRRWTIFTLALTIMATTACTRQGADTRQSRGLNERAEPDRLASPSPGGMNANAADVDARLPLVTVNGKTYVSADKLAETLEFLKDWDPASGKFQMGGTGTEYELSGGSKNAFKEGDSIVLPDETAIVDGALHIPVSAIGDLLQEEVVCETKGSELVFHPVSEAIDPGALTDGGNEPVGGDELGFADDPQDPYKEEPPASKPVPESEEQVLGPVSLTEGLAGEGFQPDVAERGAIPAAALKNIDMNRLIATAKRYLGVNYKFGAGPYPQTGRFDCSSFTQYVYGKLGVKLPRTARAQARQGVYVSRKMLRKGDLLFFYVPGRFRSNKIVGHVGIYMGNSQMIHAYPSPKNGVQIANINSAYWKRTFLSAKRVAY